MKFIEKHGYFKISKFAKERGFDVASVEDALSRIQNKESSDMMNAPKAVPLEKEKNLTLYELITCIIF